MPRLVPAALFCLLALPPRIAAAQGSNPGEGSPAGIDPSIAAAGTTASGASSPVAASSGTASASPGTTASATQAGRPRDQRLPAGTYIGGGTLPDTTAVLPAPPLPGSPEQADDENTFIRARAYRDTPRWALATRDADLSTGNILAGFSCAMGVQLDPVRVPALARLLAHVDADMSPEISRTKNFWKRKRPFIGNDQPICVARSAELIKSPSYPSGHTTILFGTALILSELAPDRAAQILQRGRTLSESRIICGVHWLSDVQAGFIEAGSLVAALNGGAAFRADLDGARTELAALRRSGGTAPDAGECSVEADAAAHSPLFRLQPATP